MAIHIQELFDYLDANPVGNNEGDALTLMEMLHDAYVEHNSINNEKIRKIYKDIENLLSNNSYKEKEILCASICDLCAEHEVLAFSHGVAVGMVMMSEISLLP